MADSWESKRPILPLPTTAYTAKWSKKKKPEEDKKVYKKEANRARDKTRINIGVAYGRWMQLKDAKGLRTDVEVAV